MTIEEMVTEFHAAMEQPINKRLSDEEYRLRLKLIGEEWTEFAEEAAAVDLAAPGEGFIKELVDLMYVLTGTAVAMGYNLDEAIKRVHASNMSKLGPDGKAVRRADGKVLKGGMYRLPDLTDCVPMYTIADEK
jgi:predicted HAD superfamily Cof-like phosphohydrolase